MSVFLEKGQTYEDFREENHRKTMERQRLMVKLQEEQKQRTEAEREANKMPPEVEVAERIKYLKEWMNGIQVGQVDEPAKTLYIIKSLLDIVEFMYERQFSSEPPDGEQ